MRGDLQWGSSAAIVQDLAARRPDGIAVADVDRKLTFRDLHDELEAAARAFVAAGTGPGDRVAVWAPNSWQWIVAALAAHRIGAVLVPVNTRFRRAEVAHVLGRTSTDVLVLEQGFLGVDYVEMLPGANNRPSLVVDVAGTGCGGTVGWSEFRSHGEGIELPPLPDGETLADIIFTSGTTGNPKGVVATHAQNLRAFDGWADAAGMAHGDRYAITNPFFHTFGYKAGWLCGLMREMTVFPHRTLDVETLAEQIVAEDLSLLAGPPTLFEGVLARAVDLESVRTAIVGATSIPPRLIRALREEAGITRVTTCYGLTEVTGVATITGPDDEVEVLAETAGRPVTDVNVAVRPVEGVGGAQGAVGELCVRGYNVTRGYFEGGAVRPPELDEDGFLRTGDVGYFDDDGNLHVTDRLDDMFVVGGFNAYPAEIERLLGEHPSVAELAVVGVADDWLGEVGAAFVVPACEGAFDDAAFLSWARGRVANYKVPRYVHVVSRLPRNASGKVIKRELGVARP